MAYFLDEGNLILFAMFAGAANIVATIYLLLCSDYPWPDGDSNCQCSPTSTLTTIGQNNQQIPITTTTSAPMTSTGQIPIILPAVHNH
jgi:hypothetical protein